MVSLRHPLVDDYLWRLGEVARLLGQHDGDKLVGSVRARLDLMLGSNPSDDEVSKALATLGAPAAMVRAALPAGWACPRPGGRERLALFLLLGLVPLTSSFLSVAAVFWLLGAFPLMWSRLWSTEQKALAAFAWPVAIGLPFSVARMLLGSTGPSITDPVVLLLVMGPAIGLAIWLYRAAGRV
jgi:hypothetical protein